MHLHTDLRLLLRPIKNLFEKSSSILLLVFILSALLF
jgi:hypothetical protein